MHHHRPTHATHIYTCSYVGAAFVDPLAKKARTTRLGGLVVTLVAVDGDGEETARFDNGESWCMYVCVG